MFFRFFGIDALEFPRGRMSTRIDTCEIARFAQFRTFATAASIRGVRGAEGADFSGPRRMAEPCFGRSFREFVPISYAGEFLHG